MGLPFMQNKEASASAPIESMDRTPDEGSEPEMGMLDACAEDIMEAISKKDISMLKAALESLVSHIQDMDETQDEQEQT